MPDLLTTEPASPIVVKVGGALLDDPARERPLFDALARLHRDRAGGVVLVHGGGVAVDRLLAALGHETVRREGIRLTPPSQMDPIAGVLAGSVNKRLVGHLLAMGLPAVGLCLGDGGLAECAVTDAFDFDPGRVGMVKGGRGRLLEVLLREGFLPCVSSIGIDPKGDLLNVNADDAAAGLARILRARELVLLTDVAGVRGADGAILASIDEPTASRGIEAGWISGGMIAKVRGALAAARVAGVPVRIASWSDAAPLLALAAGGAAMGGTRVTIRATSPATAATPR